MLKKLIFFIGIIGAHESACMNGPVIDIKIYYDIQDQGQFFYNDFLTIQDPSIKTFGPILTKLRMLMANKFPNKCILESGLNALRPQSGYDYYDNPVVLCNMPIANYVRLPNPKKGHPNHTVYLQVFFYLKD